MVTRGPYWRVRKKKRNSLTNEGHRLIKLLWPFSDKSAYKLIARRMQLKKKKMHQRNAHFTHMDDEEVIWAVAILKREAWLRGIEPKAEIL